MATEFSEDFACPHCGARYRLVRLRSDSIAPIEAVTLDCLMCSEPLAGTDGEDILKYILTDGAGTRTPKRPPRN